MTPAEAILLSGLLLYGILASAADCFAMGGHKEPTAIVVDADTGAPIEGAVAIAIWRKYSDKTAWFEGGTQVPTRIEEAVTDKQGRIYIDGFWDWHFSKGRYPRLTIYKPEYICWDQKLIHIPGQQSEQRTDFDKKHQIARLKKWPENFSFVRHWNFVDSVTIGDAHEASQNNFFNAFNYERKLRIDERKKINEARRKKKQKGERHD
jgi:hypothetical protein